MDTESRETLDRYTGLAEVYDAYRPRPPMVIADLLAQLARTPRPRLVVDLGCGTGRSTLLWAGRADAVIGIEPNQDMRCVAEARRAECSEAGSIRFQAGIAAETGLPDGCADIVTCSQSFHWMEPKSTLAEIARILHSGGVFAAYDYQRPPTIDWEAEQVLLTFWSRLTAVREARGLSQERRWPKEEHLSHMRDCGHFRYTRESWAHNVESGNAERLAGYARSHGGISSLLRQGLSDAEMGLDVLREAADRILGSQPRPWFVGYAIRIAIK